MGEEIKHFERQLRFLHAIDYSMKFIHVKLRLSQIAWALDDAQTYVHKIVENNSYPIDVQLASTLWRIALRYIALNVINIS